MLLRKAGLIVAALIMGGTLTACHELYCSFIEGLTGVPVDCSHDAFPDLGDIEFPPLPPPPSLPTTSSSTTLPGGSTTTMPDGETTTTTSGEPVQTTTTVEIPTTFTIPTTIPATTIPGTTAPPTSTTLPG